MRSTKRVLYALGLLVVLLTATSARPAQGIVGCDPPYGSCFSYCGNGSHMCYPTSWDYFCAIIPGGCYATQYCSLCG
jgi:hypothetical protein